MVPRPTAGLWPALLCTLVLGTACLAPPPPRVRVAIDPLVLDTNSRATAQVTPEEIIEEPEEEIFEALDRAIAGRTTFIVAHRLSTLRRADFVIVMESGRIVQRGTHEELITVPGPYLHVANLQLIDSRELAELKLRAEGSP